MGSERVKLFSFIKKQLYVSSGNFLQNKLIKIALNVIKFLHQLSEEFKEKVCYACELGNNRSIRVSERQIKNLHFCFPIGM